MPDLCASFSSAKALLEVKGVSRGALDPIIPRLFGQFGIIDLVSLVLEGALRPQASAVQCGACGARQD
jgi:hypothetical protein